MEYVKNDGGRKEAGYKGQTGDCGTRAIAIATGLPYQEVYDLVIEISKRDRITKNKKDRSHPRTGIWIESMHRIMKHLGWQWTPTMFIGSGCKVHVNADELPEGTLMLRLSGHYAVVKDGVLYDTYDSSRNETRCVYGYWSK